MKTITCWFLALGVALLIAGEASAQRSPSLRAVRTMERNVTRLANTSIGDRDFTALQTRGGAVWLRPQARIIVVSKGLSQTGFRLGSDNKLSGADRTRLTQMLEQIAPAAGGRQVLGSLRAETRRHHQHLKALGRTNPTIATLLNRASQVTGTQDVTLWQQGKSTLVYRPSTNVLVGSKGFFSRQGFFLSRTAQGLQVQSGYQQPLQQFLLGNGSF